MATDLPDDSAMFNYSDGQLAVRRLTFANDDGHKIHIQGVSHIADPDFWRSFKQTLAQYARDGWIIHYELIKGHGQLTRKERRRLKGIRRVSRIIARKSTKAGLEHQRKLEYPSGSKNVDMTAWKLASQLDFSLKDNVLFRVDSVLLAAIPFRFMKQFIAHVLLSKKSTSLSPKFDEVVLHDRNRLAVDAAASEKLDVLMVWGAAHLPGMAKLLQVKGYTLTGSQWTAIMSVSL